MYMYIHSAYKESTIIIQMYTHVHGCVMFIKWPACSSGDVPYTTYGASILYMHVVCMFVCGGTQWVAGIGCHRPLDMIPSTASTMYVQVYSCFDAIPTHSFTL